MKKILFITILLVSSLTAMAQENVATRHIFKIGAYKFVCEHYDEEKGGGTYWLKDGMSFRKEEIDTLTMFIYNNFEKIEKKANIYIYSGQILRFSKINRDLLIPAGYYLVIYKKDKFDEWCDMRERKKAKELEEERERIKSLFVTE